MVIGRDPDIFTLITTSCEINRNYLDEIERTLLKGVHHDDQVVIDCEKGNYSLTKGSLKRLLPNQWFNDEIINGYVSLINLREKETGSGNVFCFNSFFYTLLESSLSKGQYDFKKLERIVTKKKVNLRNYKMIVIPVNIQHYHWFVLAADLPRNTIYIIDSLTHLEEAA